MSTTKSLLTRLVGPVAVLGALLVGTSTGRGGEPTAPVIEGGRAILEASRSAVVALDAARERIGAEDAAFRQNIDDARNAVAGARVATRDASWPRDLVRLRARVGRQLGLADRTLARSERAAIADRLPAVDRCASIAAQHLQRVAALVEDRVPPAPPLTDRPNTPPTPVTPPVAAPRFTWTTFTKSADTRVFYVSYSTGSDSNDGLAPDRPVKTLLQGYRLLRDGYPDWLLLKRGDTWEIGAGYDGLGQNYSPDIMFRKSGRSATERMVISTYGTGPRPYLKSRSDTPVIWMFPNDVKVPIAAHVAFVGLDCKAFRRDPSDPGWVSTAGAAAVDIAEADDILFEDCRFAFFRGLVMRPVAVNATLRNISLRGCVVSDSYSTTSHCQGLYTSEVRNLLLEGSAFIRNGWHPTLAKPTVYNRNLYISNSPGTVMRECIDADGASGGAQLRLGGICERNLFLRAPLGVTFGHPENPAGSVVTGTIRQNVILGGRDIDTQPRASAIGLQTTATSTTVYENIVAHNVDGTGNVTGIFLQGEDVTTPGGIDIYGNIVYDWEYQGNGEGIKFVPSKTGSLRLTAVTVRDNVFHQKGNGLMVLAESGVGLSGVQFLRNQYYTGRASTSWFRVGTSFYSLSSWSSLSGDTGSVTTTPTYPDPDRDIASYMRSLGRTGALDEFLTAVKSQSRDENWNDAFTASAVIDYVRTGFGWSPLVR